MSSDETPYEAAIEQRLGRGLAILYAVAMMCAASLVVASPRPLPPPAQLEVREACTAFDPDVLTPPANWHDLRPRAQEVLQRLVSARAVPLDSDTAQLRTVLAQLDALADRQGIACPTARWLLTSLDGLAAGDPDRRRIPWNE